MADGDLYDEFGNYIGPELSESEEVRWQAGTAGECGMPACRFAWPGCHVCAMEFSFWLSVHRRMRTSSSRQLWMLRGQLRLMKRRRRPWRKTGACQAQT
jgi:hypothetical protein